MLHSAKLPPQWAVQDSNNPKISAAKPHVASAGAVKSAAFKADSSFAAAVAAVMRLPLSDIEKAEAVRRLLAEHQEGDEA